MKVEDFEKKYSFQPVKRTSMSSLVIEEIAKMLLNDELKIGDKIPSEYNLLETLSVSRPIVREALIALDTLGIIEKKNNIYIVSEKIGTTPFKLMLSLTATDMKGIIDIRIMQELGFVTLAAENISIENLEKMYKTIEGMKKGEGSYDQLDKEFHKIIALSSSNIISSGIIEPLMNYFYGTYNQINKEKRNPEITIKQHEKIYIALKEHNPLEAYKAMYEHLDFVRKRINEISNKSEHAEENEK